MNERRFKLGGELTKEEFAAQFEETSEELLIKVNWSWERGDSPMPSIGNEVLTHMNYICPWTADETAPFGHGGQMFWFCKKKLIGYPYPPKFKRDACYKVRVRRCRYEETRNQLLLEEVVAENVNPAEDSSLYNSIASDFMERFEQKTKEVLIYNEQNVDVTKASGSLGGVIGSCYGFFLAVADSEESQPKAAQGRLIILHDTKLFKDNRQIKLKEKTIYRIRVRESKEKIEGNTLYLLEQLLASDVRNDELKQLGEEMLKPVPWMVEGVGEFLIDRESGDYIAHADIPWNSPGSEDGGYTVNVQMACDEENPRTAVKSSAIIRNIMEHKSEWENRIFDFIADECMDATGEEGLIETWEEEDNMITREAFIKRLSVSYINIDEEGNSEVWIELDDMFTDHCYWLDVLADGRIESHGLMG